MPGNASNHEQRNGFGSIAHASFAIGVSVSSALCLWQSSRLALSGGDVANNHGAAIAEQAEGEGEDLAAARGGGEDGAADEAREGETVEEADGDVALRR